METFLNYRKTDKINKVTLKTKSAEPAVIGFGVDDMFVSIFAYRYREWCQKRAILVRLLH